MRLIVEQAALARVTARMAAVAHRGGPIPILQHLLIDARDDGVWMAATNLDMEIRERIDAQVEQPGRITVNAAALSEIARNATGGVQVAIVVDPSEDPRAFVKFGRSKYRLPVLDPGDFPSWSALAHAAELTLPAADLLALLDHVHFAQSTEETRYYLCGTHLAAVSDQGQAAFRVVATDSHRMVIDQRPVPTGTSMPGVIVPRAAVAEFRRVLSGSKADARLGVSTVGVSLEVGEARLITKTIDGSYPDYERIVPRAWDREIVVDRLALQHALKRVALISTEKSRSVKLVIDDGVLTLSVRNQETGVAEEEIEVEDDGKAPFEIGFNPRLLLDILDQTDADRMLFRFSDSASPARLDPGPGTQGADAIINIVMPLRV